MTSSDDLPIRSSATPLVPILAFVFIASLGTGVVINGLFFLARHRFDFTDTHNYGLASLLGATYVLAALCIGPTLSRAMRSSARLSSRAVLGTVTVLPGIGAMVPLGADKLGLDSGGWSLWMLCATYGLLTGVLWPIAESFVSGGRTGQQLRAATGRFNIVWAAALVTAFWIMGPFTERYPLELLAGLGAVHLITPLLLRLMPSEPPRHIPAHAEPVARSSRLLLAVFRIQLPASYLVMSALSPYLPTQLERLDVTVAWQTPLVSTWMCSRLAVFLLMERWHRWHGSWSASYVGGLLMLGGFALCLLAPKLGSSTIALVWLVVGLASFGAGLGVIYTAALYYAMEVGKADVQAGGKHEALIGLGYTLGPVCGLGAIGSARLGVIDSDSIDLAILSAVGALSGLAAMAAGYRAVRLSRTDKAEPEPKRVSGGTS